jgi:hypothetical protein
MAQCHAKLRRVSGQFTSIACVPALKAMATRSSPAPAARGAA